MDKGEAEQIDKVAKLLGVRVRFVDEVRGGTANAQISGAEIEVEKGNQNPVLYLDYALYGTKDTDHYLEEALLKQLPQKLETPIAVFASQTQSGTSVVALLEMIHNGKSVITPVVVDGFARQNGIVIDSNAASSTYAKGNAVTKLLNDAIKQEVAGNVSVFYLDKGKATGLLQKAGHQLSGVLFLTDGFIHNIRDKGSPVNIKMEDVTHRNNSRAGLGIGKKGRVRLAKSSMGTGRQKSFTTGQMQSSGHLTRDWGLFPFGIKKRCGGDGEKEKWRARYGCVS